MAEIDLEAVHDTLVALAIEAGRMIRTADTGHMSIGTKMNCAYFYPFFFFLSFLFCLFSYYLKLPSV